MAPSSPQYQQTPPFPQPLRCIQRLKASEKRKVYWEKVLILTTCVLLHSSVGLLQGVCCSGALCCGDTRERGNKGVKTWQALFLALPSSTCGVRQTDPGAEGPQREEACSPHEQDCTEPPMMVRRALSSSRHAVGLSSKGQANLSPPFPSLNYGVHLWSCRFLALL